MPEKKTITLYLAGWQQRMIADHVAADHLKGLVQISKIKLSTKFDPGSLVMYRVPDPIIVGHWSLYLTDEQILIAKARLGVKTNLSAINISPEHLKSGAISFE